MDVVQTLLLAVVQGLTEFLPISSSAHLVLLAQFLGGVVQPVGIDIVLHAATLFAVLLYFRKDVASITLGCVRNERKYLDHALSLFLATIPIVIVGGLLYQGVEVFRATPFIATALIFSATFLLIIDLCFKRGLLRTSHSLYQRSMIVGLFQALAVLPGVSRSGITMAGGLLTGLSRVEAARFSFLLAIPAITGALLLVLVDTDFGGDLSILLIAILLTSSIAYAVIHAFLKLIERVGYIPFCIYQIILGVFLLL